MEELLVSKLTVRLRGEALGMRRGMGCGYGGSGQLVGLLLLVVDLLGSFPALLDNFFTLLDNFCRFAW